MFDVAAYIESGTIEACLLGQASPAELAELNRLAAQHPEIASEVAAVRAALDSMQVAYAQAAATPPPPALKARILAAAEAAIPAAQPQSPAPPTKLPPRIPAWPVWLAVAALLVAALGFYLYVQESRAHATLATQYAEQAADHKALTITLDSLASDFAALTSAYETLALRCSRHVELKGLAIAPDARAFVYWNEQDGSVRAEVERLPAPPAGKAYQLWAIVDGKPFDLGMLPMRGDSLSLTRMPKPVRGATAFALTLEKEEGVPQPEGEMYVMGAV